MTVYSNIGFHSTEIDSTSLGQLLNVKPTCYFLCSIESTSTKTHRCGLLIAPIKEINGNRHEGTTVRQNNLKRQ